MRPVLALSTAWGDWLQVWSEARPRQASDQRIQIPCINKLKAKK